MSAAAIASSVRPLVFDAVPSSDRAFGYLLAGSLGLVIASAVIVARIELPEPVRARAAQDPLTVLWTAPEPAPPKPAPPRPAPPKPRPRPAGVSPPPEPVAETPVAAEPESVASVRERAREAGVLAFADLLADLRAETAVNPLAETGIVQRGPGEAPRLERTVLTTTTRDAPPVAVDVADFARVSGGVALAGRETTRVRALPGDARPRGGVGARRVTHNDRPARSLAEIRRVFDANKGAIFAIYNRALRSQPGIAGKVVFEMVIEPSGEVTTCRVISSEIEQTDLIERLVRRVRMFDFGARPVERTTVTYPVHFLPG